jgi:hypothetical protein
MIGQEYTSRRICSVGDPSNGSAEHSQIIHRKLWNASLKNQNELLFECHSKTFQREPRLIEGRANQQYTQLISHNAN